MKIVILTDSSTYEVRGSCAADILRAEGHQVTLIGSDFDHRGKCKRGPAPAGCIYLRMHPYQKNLSLKRLYAQADFARRALKKLETLKIDLLYVMIPGNSLTRCAAMYRRRNPQAKIVIDIIDLWPEALPFGRLKNSLPARLWRRLRDAYIGCADLVITECELYREILAKVLAGKQAETLYWPLKETQEHGPAEENGENSRLGICYLGSVNHIIDIDCIAALLHAVHVRREIELHIIGSGERLAEFCRAVEEKGIPTCCYGAVYDAEKKRGIMSRCSYGINIMRPQVCVGLTMKSVEYMQNGLMLLNTIGGDSRSLVETAGIGINVDRKDLRKTAEEIVKRPVGGKDRKRVYAVYQQYFSSAAFAKKLKNSLGPLLQ